MSNSRHILLIASLLGIFCSHADAQFKPTRIASFDSPIEARRFTGGREVQLSEDGKTMIAAFYGSAAQLFELQTFAAIGEPIRTAGDGEVGFVNNEIAYTADWDSLRFWDCKTGQILGDPIRHELREDTIIPPAVSPQGNLIATRATIKSVEIFNVSTFERIGVELKDSADVRSIQFSANGELLLVAAGRSLYAIDTSTGKNVEGPIESGWLFRYFSKQQRLLTTEQEDGIDWLVIRATDQKGWPVTYRSRLPGRLKKVISLDDDRLLLQATKSDYAPAMFIFSLDDPESRVEVESEADRAFGVVVPQEEEHWICSNIRDISCYRLGESKPIWRKPVPPSGYDLRLFPFDNEHFIVVDKQENFGVYKIADGERVWNQTGVKEFRLSQNRIVFCRSDGVEVWSLN